jgi:hypothetical protein
VTVAVVSVIPQPLPGMAPNSSRIFLTSSGAAGAPP